MVLALLALALFTRPGDPEAESDWPQWRGARGDGLSHGGSWSSTGKAVWTAEIGLGYSAPSVARGSVVAYGHDVARALDVLRCLDEESGRELWRAEAPGELRANQHEGGTLSTPAIDGERVLVCSSSGLVSCHRLVDGELLWRADLVERHGVDPQYYGFAQTEARVSFDARPCYRVAATTGDGRQRTLYFETDSGLLAGREAEDEGLAIYRDYRAFDGLLVATSQRVFRPDGGLEEHFQLEHVEFGPLDETSFARSPRIDELLGERAAEPR